jgi:hypothetical protein
MEKIAIRVLIALYAFGFSTYLFTTVVPLGKFHTYDTSVYGPTENVRYLRTVFDLKDEFVLLFPNLTDWTRADCGVDWQRILEGLGAQEVGCKEYSKGDDLIWFFIVHGNESEMFHSVESCYTYFGYQITSQQIEPIQVVRGELGEITYPINITVNTVMIELQKDGDHRIALYWFLFESPYKDVSQGAYLYRLSSPVTESVEETKELLKTMAAASMIGTFEYPIEDTVFEQYSNQYGILFYLILIIAYLVIIILFIKPEILPIF